MDNEEISVRTKTWIQDGNRETVFGFGQLKILETIEKSGSINAAAKDMKMGYRSMWGRIRKVEERIGKPLLIRQKGGVAGGKSELTEDAIEMVRKFKELQSRVNEAAAAIFKEIYFPE